jgi:hypothetical protein
VIQYLASTLSTRPISLLLILQYPYKLNLLSGYAALALTGLILDASASNSATVFLCLVMSSVHGILPEYLDQYRYQRIYKWSWPRLNSHFNGNGDVIFFFQRRQSQFCNFGTSARTTSNGE